MGALRRHFEEVETEHKLEVGELKMRIIDLECELSEMKSRYDILCTKIKKGANDKRNIDSGDEFLRNYARGWE